MHGGWTTIYLLHCIFIGSRLHPSDIGGPSSHHDDDVFVNLDAFDMFVEFPDLELDTKHGFLHSGTGHLHSSPDDLLVDTTLPSSGIDAKGDPSLHLVDGNENLLIGGSAADHQDLYTITDYSPEWAFTDGGVKVLVTGPWDASSQYTVLFDAFPVPTTVVQAGVLRCFCPAHEVGLATVQVACDGFVVSNSVIFEYKAPANVETACEAGSTANDTLYRLSLYNRLEAVDDRMQIKSEPRDMVRIIILFNISFTKSNNQSFSPKKRLSSTSPTAKNDYLPTANC